jgi:hypothetical protein
MLYLCILVEVGIVAAYLSAGYLPFAMPISVMGDEHDRHLYHGIVAALTVVWCVYATHCWRHRFLPDMLCVAAIGSVLLALQFLTNESASHDGLSVSVIVMTCVLTVRIAHRLDSWLLLWLSVPSLLSCSLLFSRDLTLIGIAENIVLAIALLLVTIDMRTAVVRSSRTWLHSVLAPRNHAGWPPGMAQASFWALASLLIIGMSDAIQNGRLAGPIIVVCGWCGGYLAWRDDMSVWLRLTVLTSCAVATLALLCGLSAVSVQLETVIPICFLLSVTYAVLFLVDAHAR